MKTTRFLLICFFLIVVTSFRSAVTSYSCQIGLLKYNGGGDWYANLETSIPNLIAFCNENLHTTINPEQAIVEVGSAAIFNYPFVHLTGHGNIVLTNMEVQNLRSYMLSGGFVHISDNYGLDKFIRPQMKKVFPELDFVEIPFTHPIYHQFYEFPSGLPKVHEHDGKAPQGLGLFWQGTLVCFYDFESDLGDGWESSEVHHDSEEARMKALKMGANLVQYALLGGASKK